MKDSVIVIISKFDMTSPGREYSRELGGGKSTGSGPIQEINSSNLFHEVAKLSFIDYCSFQSFCNVRDKPEKSIVNPDDSRQKFLLPFDVCRTWSMP